MATWNNGASTGCIFCSDSMETRDHLFFNCPFSAEIWRNLTHKLLDSNYTNHWDTILRLLVNSHQNNLTLFLLRYTFQVSIHTIWRERNGRRHGEAPTRLSQLVKCIDKQVRNRLSTIRAMGDNNFNKGMELWFATR